MNFDICFLPIFVNCQFGSENLENFFLQCSKMPKNSEKKNLLKSLIEASCVELLLLDDSGKCFVIFAWRIYLSYIFIDEEEEDNIFDTLIENVCIVSAHRYAIPRTNVVKSSEWISMVLPNISDERFKMMIRLTREQFHFTLSKIESDAIFNCGPNHQYSVAIQLTLTLYRLGAYGDGASIVRIAALFGIGDGGTIEKITRRVLDAIFKLRNEYLRWPTTTETQKLIAGTLDELPNCIGYLDGTEIKLAEKPCRDPDSYYSRKQNFCCKMQGVCDRQLKIRHIHVGFPGSVHDSRVFVNSSLFLKQSYFFEGEEWLAADSACKLSTSIITPFRKNSPESEHVIQIQQVFFKISCSCRT